MYRKPRGDHEGNVLDLDSLMDILSCLVGVMLFLVIYTVLELGSTTYAAEVPVLRSLPVGSERVVVVCHQGTVRVLDARGPLQGLLSGIEIIEYDEADFFARQANERAPSDEFFEYSLIYEDRVSSFGAALGALDLRVEEIPGIVGDSLHHMVEGSRYLTRLEALDPSLVWLSFVVDGESLDVFRRARELAMSRGFAVGFDPVAVEFPVIHTLSEGGAEALMSARMILAKPER